MKKYRHYDDNFTSYWRLQVKEIVNNKSVFKSKSYSKRDLVFYWPTRLSESNNKKLMRFALATIPLVSNFTLLSKYIREIFSKKSAYLTRLPNAKNWWN